MNEKITSCRKCGSLLNSANELRTYRCNKCLMVTHKKYFYSSPWMRTFFLLRNRCNNENNPHYKFYGGKGVRALISKEQIKFLWLIDNAKIMKSPSIDRIDSNGDYCFENCRFIEKNFNCSRGKHGENNPRAKLSNNDVLEILDLFSKVKTGRKTMAIVAEQYGVCSKTIECIVYGYYKKKQKWQKED